MPPQDRSPERNPRRDELSSALANRYCRFVLSYFTDSSDEVASVADLSATIARTIDRPDRTSVTIQLHHAALPRLDDVGIVDYDARSETVRYRGHPRLEDWQPYNGKDRSEPTVESE